MKPNVTASVRPLRRFATDSGQIAALRTLQFVNYATVITLNAYFPLYFNSIGYTNLQIGALMSVGPLLAIVANMLVGVLSDRIRNLRLMMSLLLSGQILTMALLLPTKEFSFVAVILAVFYLFQTPMIPVLDSASLLASARMNRSFASIRLFGSLGAAISSVGFGYLLNHFGSLWTVPIALASVAVAFAVSRLIGDYQSNLKKFEFAGLAQVMRKATTLAFFAVIMLVSIAHRMNEGFLSLAMREIGAPDALIGYGMLVSGICEIPMFFVLAKFGHRFRELPLLAFASLMYALRLALMAVADEPWMMIALQGMHMLTFAIFYITALRFMQAIIPDEYRASGMGVFTIFWAGMAGLVTGALGGWLFDAFGHAAVFLSGAGFALLGCLGFLAMSLRRE